MIDPPPVPLSQRIRAALRSRTVRDTVINASGTGLSAVLSFGALLIATNAMGPSSFGRFALGLAVLMMASELADLGVNAGLIRHASARLGAGDAHGARVVLSVGLRVKFATATAGAVLVAGLAGPGASLLGNPDVAPLLRVAAVGVAGAVMLGYLSALLQAHQRFARNASLQVAHWTLRLVGTAFLAAAGEVRPESLLWLYATSTWFLCGVGLVLAPAGSVAPGLWDREIARQVVSFSRWMALWGVFWICLTRLDLLLVGLLSGEEQAGYYAISQRVALLVTLMVNAYLMTLIPKLSRIQDLPELRRGMRTATWVVALVAAGVLLAIPVTPWLVPVFGSEFSGAAAPLGLLLLGASIQILAMPAGAALYALDRPQAFALASGLGLAVSVTGNLLFVPRFGAAGAGAVFVAVASTLLAVYQVEARRAFRRGAMADAG